jgi:glycosyltransferase involved in cell wall biosynthesis
MLGWEFPPLFSGGLGVATYGLVKALSPLSSIRLIVPTAAPASDLSAVNVIGLNQVTANEIDLERVKFNFNFSNTEVNTLPISVSPYHFTNEAFEKSEKYNFLMLQQGKATIDVVNEIFSSKEVYGMDILWKVQLFASMAEELSAGGNFDVIHAHDWITYQAAIRIKKRTGKPVILHVHALETDRVGESTRNEIYWIEKHSFENADSIVAVSQCTKEQIIKHYGIDASKISVVHNGVDPITPKRETHALRDKLVVFLGRLTHQKGSQFLVEIAEKVSRVYPRVKFVVAGTGDQFAHILETSAYKKLGHKFIFTGFLTKSKVNELLAMADVYFMPSVSEPFGLTALEAAQHHVPSVISAQSGVAEVLKSSLKADFWDTDKYANYIYALLKYNALGNELSEKAAKELEGLTWGHAAEKILNEYQHIINRKF